MPINRELPSDCWSIYFWCSFIVLCSWAIAALSRSMYRDRKRTSIRLTGSWSATRTLDQAATQTSSNFRLTYQTDREPENGFAQAAGFRDRAS